jgi:predicted RNA binding protein YcfA (HicA-like mRNA interferase family)
MKWKPCKRVDFIKKLRALGFQGAYSGAKHQFMVFKQCRLTIPSNSEYSVSQLRMMIREAEDIIERKVTVEEWNDLP